MRVVLDACVPRRFAAWITGHDVTTVGELFRTTDFDDGPLLKQLSGRCDVFVTVDRSICFQQALGGLPFGLVVLRA